MDFVHTLGIGLIAVAGLRILDIAWPANPLPMSFYVAEGAFGVFLLTMASRATP